MIVKIFNKLLLLENKEDFEKLIESKCSYQMNLLMGKKISSFQQSLSINNIDIKLSEDPVLYLICICNNCYRIKEEDLLGIL